MALTVVSAKNPIVPVQTREVGAVAVTPGMTIADALKLANCHPGAGAARVTLDGREISRDQWGTTPADQAGTLTVELLAEGGGGSNPFRIVLSIALMAAAPYLGGALGLGGFATKLATGIISVGGNLLINAITPAPRARISNGANLALPNQTYSINGFRNSARPFQPMPLIYGLHRVAPDISSKPRMRFISNEQHVSIIFNYSINQIDEPTNHMIGETEIDNFAFSTTATGTSGQKLITVANGVDIDRFDRVTASGVPSGTWVDKVDGKQITLSANLTAGLSNTAITFQHVDYQWAANGAGITKAADNVETQSVGTELTANQTGAVFSGAAADVTDRPVGQWFSRTGVSDSVWLECSFQGRCAATLQTVSGNEAVSVQIQYKLTSSGTWIDLNKGTAPQTGLIIAGRIVGKNSDEKRFSVFWEVPQGTYDVRVRAYGDYYNSSANYSTRTRNLYWLSFAQGQKETGSYAGQYRLGVRMRASGNLAGQLDNWSSLCQARSYTWTGSAWVEAATRNPAWAFLDFCLGKRVSGRLLYGVGLYSGNSTLDGSAGQTAQIDLASIQAWASFCDTNSLTFDAVIDSATTCLEVLEKIARAGRAAPTWQSGKLGVIIDQANQTPVATFGMYNIRKGSFQVDYISESLVDEIEATFVNAALDYQQDTVRVSVPGVTTPKVTGRVDLFGVTSATKALEEARLLAASQYYHRRRITWETDVEGLLVARGDVVYLSHDLTSWDASGRIVDWNAGTKTLTLDREVTRGAGDYINLRWPNGFFQILQCVSGSGTSNQVQLVNALPVLDDESNSIPAPGGGGFPFHDWAYQFGPSSTPGKRVKIVSIKPISQHAAQIEAVDDDPGYYGYSSGTYTAPTTPTLQDYTPTDLRVTETLDRMERDLPVSRILITWEGVSGATYILRYRIQIDDIGPTGEPTIEYDWKQISATGNLAEIEAFEGSKIDIVIEPFVKVGTWSTASTSYTVLGRDGPPADVTGVTVSPAAGGESLEVSWDASPDIDVAEYIIKRQYGPGFVGPLQTFDQLGVYAKTTSTTITVDPRALLETGQLFVLWIKAADSSGNQSTDYAVASYAPDPPAAPTNLRATQDGQSILLEWDSSPYEEGLIVEYEIRGGTSSTYVFNDIIGHTRQNSFTVPAIFGTATKYFVKAGFYIGTAPPSIFPVIAPASRSYYSLEIDLNANPPVTPYATVEITPSTYTRQAALVAKDTAGTETTTTSSGALIDGALGVAVAPASMATAAAQAALVVDAGATLGNLGVKTWGGPYAADKSFGGFWMGPETGQWLSGLNFESNSGGSPIVTVEVPADAAGGTQAIVKSTATGANQTLELLTAGSTRVYIDSSGRIIEGTTGSQNLAYPGFNNNYAFEHQIHGTSYLDSALAICQWSTSATASGGAAISLNKSRGGIGTETKVESGDRLGVIGFSGTDGTKFCSAAEIVANVAGTPTTDGGSVSAYLAFKTTDVGDLLPTEAMRIDNQQRVIQGSTSIQAADTIGNWHHQWHGVQTDGTNNRALGLFRWDTGATGPIFSFNKSNSTSPGFFSAVTQGDTIGALYFNGADSDSLQAGAIFKAVADQTWSNSARGTEFIFQTSTNNTAGPTEKVRITNDGRIGIGTQQPASTLAIKSPINGAVEITSQAAHAATLGPVIWLARRDGTGTGPNGASGDYGGSIDFANTNDAGETIAFARIYQYLNSPADGAESSLLIFQNIRNGSMNMRMQIGSGIKVGTATGGDKGDGTINCAGDIYKNNAAYNNPDYALEHFYTGKIEQFADNDGAADYPGLMPLEELDAFMRQNFHLPRVPREDGAGIFERSDFVLEKLEEISVHLVQLNERIKKLEQK